MQRRLCEMSEAKWSITEAKCLQISHNKYASQRDAISYSMGYLMLSHSAGMHNTDKSIAGISKRFHFASRHYIFSAYLPTHIKFLTEFHRIFFGTTCISFPMIFHWEPSTFSMLHTSILLTIYAQQTLRHLCPRLAQCAWNNWSEIIEWRIERIYHTPFRIVKYRRNYCQLRKSRIEFYAQFLWERSSLQSEMSPCFCSCWSSFKL